ncbi:hypothetical protein PR001_g14827 [Phytophthora rubi]|uniref:SWIM-type domain-containing protein n=1 Tax=Phytophthora rubi TaxID=129364 RepID=A0A6A3KTM2_9STRA|nr:hypothetical protein PR002_g15284 [Phytophthora rubi]KAE9015719.1 hypothetical protein PR001_g14827 [Phytophthora rubi]
MCMDSLRASTAVVLNDSIPGILRGASLSAPRFTSHFAEGPLQETSVVGSRNLLQNKLNFRQKFSGRGCNKVLAAVFFNAPKYTHLPGRTGCDLDAKRQKTYLDSVTGKLLKDKNVVDAKLLYHSMHQVLVLNPALSPPGPLLSATTWTIAQIAFVRASYRCDCKDFMISGWQCMHVVAAMVLRNEFSVDAALSVLPVRRNSGRPRRSRGALDADQHQHHVFFSVDRLIRLFPEYPARPLH